MVDASRIETWQDAVVWLRNQTDRRQLVLDAYYDDPLLAAAKRYRPKRCGPVVKAGGVSTP